MKRIIIPGLMLAAAFALTNCTEQLVTLVQEEDVIYDETAGLTQKGDVFEVFVEDVETKSSLGSNSKITWVEGDKMSLYSGTREKTPKYTYHNAFSWDGTTKSFYGTLSDGLSNANDWFAIYPYNSGSGDTPAKVRVTVGGSGNADGKYIQSQFGANDWRHVAQDSPLYGIKNNVPHSKKPKFTMSPLFSILALNVVNHGSGQPIKITSAEFVSTQNIVGEFDLDIFADNGPTLKAVSGKASKTASLELAPAVSVAHNESTNLYFAVLPSTIKANSTVTVRINGIARAIELPQDLVFEVGKITTLSVEVLPLAYPTDNDALNMTSDGSKVFNMSEATTKTMIVNGKEITGYILGEGGKSEKLTVKGTVKDLLNALDVGFNASSWKGQKTAMTVNHINLWIDGTQFASYDPFLKAIRSDLGITSGLIWGFMELGVKALFSSGVDRDGLLFGLTDFMDPTNITFVGVVENGTSAPASGETPNIVLLSENEINKEVSTAAVENLLKTKFDYQQADGTVLLPTFEGLNDIINGNPNTAAANETANAIYNKLQASIGNKSFTADGIGTLHVWKIFQGIFASPEDMKAKLPNLKVSVDIATIPYSAEKGAYGSKGNPKTPSGSYNPIVIWGLDITTAAEKQQMSN